MVFLSQKFFIDKNGKTCYPKFMIKKCSKCNVDKDLETGFHANKISADGRHTQCKDCRRPVESDRTRKRYAENRLDPEPSNCEICRKTIGERRADRDHCHLTGRRRGNLCRACNMGLGLFKDNVEILKTAIQYLKKYETLENI